MRLVYYLPSLYILSSLFVYFLACHLSSLYLCMCGTPYWVVLDAVYIALRVLLVLLSGCGNFCLDAIYTR